jgi:2-C-methyl-D-erythritol 4-phosphate cytidylyltransferase
MGNPDKLLMEVAGIPVVGHTWARFDACDAVDQISVVIRKEQMDLFHELAFKIKTRKPFRLVIGGKERQDSVWNALDSLERGTILVAIQDGARPCTSDRVIKATFAAANEFGAAVAAQRVTDTIKESLDGQCISRHLDRSRLWAVQTPQAFSLSIIRRALAVVREKGLLVTDDTAACELIGQEVKLVESTEPNPKLTFAEDVPVIERLLRCE